MNISIPKGVFDIVPNPVKEELSWQASDLWAYVEGVIRRISYEYGFREIRTPLFERTELFKRGVGETSDIVTKEMYTFDDKGGRSMTLRPEGTASVLRSFLEKSMHHSSPLNKLFYIAPMFRYERQQAGRYRQHHQFGVEAIGGGAPEHDAEVIAMMYNFYKRLGIEKFSIKINSVGDAESRNRFRDVLQDVLRPHLPELSADSKERFEKNPLRILDSKAPEDQQFIREVPSILDSLNDECRDHFSQVCSLLDDLSIPYDITPSLVRGLDYYSNTVFEATADDLGAQNSIGGGGRYASLIKTLGGPDLPAIGFGIGIERVIMTMLSQGAKFPEKPHPTLYIIPLGDEARSRCFLVLQNLRDKGIAAEMDFSGKKLKKVMGYADSIGAKYSVVVGADELASGTVKVKEMSSGDVRDAALDALADILTS